MSNTVLNLPSVIALQHRQETDIEKPLNKSEGITSPDNSSFIPLAVPGMMLDKGCSPFSCLLTP